MSAMKKFHRNSVESPFRRREFHRAVWQTIAPPCQQCTSRNLPTIEEHQELVQKWDGRGHRPAHVRSVGIEHG